MLVEWGNKARNDLKEYIKYSKTSNSKEYIIQLIEYTTNLTEYPNLGKIQYIYNGFEIRQLVFKMHKIYYYIKDNKVIIIAVLHTNANIARITKNLRGLIY